MTALTVEELERRFGDPWDQTNPVGHAATVAADERATVTTAGERLLDHCGLNAELVPTGLGGRFRRLDELIQLMRAVFRRDPALCMGYCGSSLIAAVNLWTAGGPDQQRTAARVLLGNGRIAAAFHELAHGNDLGAAEMVARRQPDGSLQVSGHKEVIGNAERAAALVLFARTPDDVGGHSVLLAEKATLGAGIRYLPRFGSNGLRGVELGGIELRDCPLPGSSVVGEPGRGMAVALRSFQLTRVALPAVATGCVDTGLRTAMRFVCERMLYGRRVSNLPYVRAILTEAFVDLLVCEVLSGVAARAAHLVPAELSVLASATKYLLPQRLTHVMYRLSTVLGAHFYIREGRYVIFQKHLRDIVPLGFLHAGAAACLATILPQLPRLARRTWQLSDPDQPDPELFRLGAPLPELRFERLRIVGTGQDPVTATLAGEPDRHTVSDGLAGLTARFRAELTELAQRCATIPPSELGVDTSADALGLGARYSYLLAAAACLGVWRGNPDDDLLSDPEWTRAALIRIAGWMGHMPGQLPDDLSEHLFTRLLDRHEDNRGFGVGNHHLPG